MYHTVSPQRGMSSRYPSEQRKPGYPTSVVNAIASAIPTEVIEKGYLILLGDCCVP
jgi:hypothetical protein